MSCPNAKKVLPSRLLSQLRRHVPAGLLWIPGKERRRLKTASLPDRDRLMREARARRMTIEAIAKAFRVSTSRTWEIVRNVRMRRADADRRPA
jgi:hypothetical protein